MNKKVHLIDLGEMSYKDAWDLQEQLFQNCIQTKSNNRRAQTNLPTKNYFLYVAHPHVYTLGKSGHAENLLISQEQMEALNISFYKTNRGGDITYHGPGQVVGYPILDLENFFTDIGKYLRFIEEAILRTLAEYNIKGERSPGETGVWLDVGTPFARKICAIGVRTSRWVTMHGFALNVTTDLGYFDHIIPCGIKKGVTSLQLELNDSRDQTVLLEEVKEKILKHFSDLFEATFMKKTESEVSVS